MQQKSSQQDASGLKFPISRISKYLANGQYGVSFSKNFPVALATALEYLSAEILELSGNSAQDMRKMRIVPVNVVAAIQEDDELKRMYPHLVIQKCGGSEALDLWKKKHDPKRPRGKKAREAEEDD